MEFLWAISTYEFSFTDTYEIAFFNSLFERIAQKLSTNLKMTTNEKQIKQSWLKLMQNTYCFNYE